MCRRRRFRLGPPAGFAWGCLPVSLGTACRFRLGVPAGFAWGCLPLSLAAACFPLLANLLPTFCRPCAVHLLPFPVADVPLLTLLLLTAVSPAVFTGGACCAAGAAPVREAKVFAGYSRTCGQSAVSALTACFRRAGCEIFCSAGGCCEKLFLSLPRKSCVVRRICRWFRSSVG